MAQDAARDVIGGRYELTERIDHGGLRQVWRGYDSVLDREVAIKLVRSELLSTPELADQLTARFRREARTAARISRPGVPQVHDAVLDATSDRLYLVMELVRGTPLRAYLDGCPPGATRAPAGASRTVDTPLAAETSRLADMSRSGGTPLAVGWAAAVAAQIAAVLARAHAIPVVHRDLRVDNVLVSDDGVVTLLDFGTAAASAESDEHAPPELTRSGLSTPQGDLHALGLLLRELLTGWPPGRHNGPGDSRATAWPTGSDVPAELRALVDELLAGSPADRPDAQKAYERLLPFVPRLGAPAPTVAAAHARLPDPTRAFRRPGAPPRRRATPASVVAPSRVSRTVPAELRATVRAAVSRADGLLADDRHTQAAAVLHDAVRAVTPGLGAAHLLVLRLRARRAAVLLIGGNHGDALPEFDHLARAFAAASSPSGPEALDCLRQAAHCRAELGDATAALRQFREVLDRVRAAGDERTAIALDVRRSIALLLLADGDTTQAEAALRALRDDLLAVHGSEHPDTLDIEQALARTGAGGSLARPPVTASPDEPTYDIAVSFASEQRGYVHAVVSACKARGLTVMYDEDLSNDWWGRNFIREQRVIYGSRTRYFVPFLSTEYLARPIPKDEYNAAMMTAVHKGDDDYILPVLVGDVTVPPDFLPLHVGFLRAESYSPEQLADALMTKVARTDIPSATPARGAGPTTAPRPRGGGTSAAGAPNRSTADADARAEPPAALAMPRVTPPDYSRYAALQGAFEHLRDRYRDAVPGLRERGFVGTVQVWERRLTIRVEHRGRTVYALDIDHGGRSGDDRLEFGVGGTGGGVTGWATPYYDTTADRPKLKVTDFSVLAGPGGVDQDLTHEELFDALWRRLVDHLERAS